MIDAFSYPLIYESFPTLGKADVMLQLNHQNSLNGYRPPGSVPNETDFSIDATVHHGAEPAVPNRQRLDPFFCTSADTVILFVCRIVLKVRGKNRKNGVVRSVE